MNCWKWSGPLKRMMLASLFLITLILFFPVCGSEQPESTQSNPGATAGTDGGGYGKVLKTSHRPTSSPIQSLLLTALRDHLHINCFSSGIMVSLRLRVIDSPPFSPSLSDTVIPHHFRLGDVRSPGCHMVSNQTHYVVSTNFSCGTTWAGPIATNSLRFWDVLGRLTAPEPALTDDEDVPAVEGSGARSLYPTSETPFLYSTPPYIQVMFECNYTQQSSPPSPAASLPPPSPLPFTLTTFPFSAFQSPILKSPVRFSYGEKGYFEVALPREYRQFKSVIRDCYYSNSNTEPMFAQEKIYIIKDGCANDKVEWWDEDSLLRSTRFSVEMTRTGLISFIGCRVDVCLLQEIQTTPDINSADTIPTCMNQTALCKAERDSPVPIFYKHSTVIYSNWLQTLQFPPVTSSTDPGFNPEEPSRGSGDPVNSNDHLHNYPILIIDVSEKDSYVDSVGGGGASISTGRQPSSTKAVAGLADTQVPHDSASLPLTAAAIVVGVITTCCVVIGIPWIIYTCIMMRRGGDRRSQGVKRPKEAIARRRQNRSGRRVRDHVMLNGLDEHSETSVCSPLAPPPFISLNSGNFRSTSLSSAPSSTSRHPTGSTACSSLLYGGGELCASGHSHRTQAHHHHASLLHQSRSPRRPTPLRQHMQLHV